MQSFDIIEQATKDYHEALDELVAHKNELEDIIREEIRLKRPLLRRCVRKVRERRASLETLIDRNRGLFAKPKTRAFFGIRVGLRSTQASYDWPDDASLAKRIRSVMPDQESTLIKVTETPIKDALKTLSESVLKKLGVGVSRGKDAVTVKPIAGDVDAAVEALLAPVDQEDKKLQPGEIPPA